MKGNTEKCHLVMSTDQSVNFQLGGSLLERSDSEKMFGVKITNLILTNMWKPYAVKLIINWEY